MDKLRSIEAENGTVRACRAALVHLVNNVPLHALLPGSPAIDAGDNTDASEWDQRGEGFLRIVNGIIDIGAFEVQEWEQ